MYQGTERVWDGTKSGRLFKPYWDRQRIVPKTGKFFGGGFRMGGRLTQGDPTPPMIFNIMVDAVVRAVLDGSCRPQEAQHSFGWAAGDRNVIFYADDGRIAGWDHGWVQDALLATVVMFHKMVL